MGSPYLIYRDEQILVTEKPAGLLCVPGRGPDKADCLYSRLLEDYPELLVVHRIDQPTSGLMIWARDKETQRNLGRQFEQRQVKKSYEALLCGSLPEKSGRISLFQRLDPDKRPLQVIDPERGKEGITLWEFIEETSEGFWRVSLSPQTGRTHQLRLHMASMGCPILGDTLYGSGEDKRSGRMCLHAASLELVHPASGEPLVFQSETPF